MAIQQTNEVTKAEQDFRSSLEDFVLVAETLAGLCNSPEEMVDVAKLAITNNAQLRIMIALVFQGQKK